MNTIKILIAADFHPHGVIGEMIVKHNYSFFDDVQPIISASDYAILNMESPVVTNARSKEIVKNGPCLKCPAETINAIKQAGFKGVTLANNHFYDYGEDGVMNTLNACSKAGLDYVGGGKNIEEASRILYKEIKGIRIAFVNFCENEFSIASTEKGGSAPLNPVTNYYQIKEARANADYVIVIVHGGTEGYQLPTPRMQDTYRFFVDSGADVVINHHQHCLSGYELYHEKPIFYGLGNFCFPQDVGESTPLWENGYMVQLKIGETVSFELIPYNQCGKEPKVKLLNNKNNFEIQIKHLNDIINNRNELEGSFEKMASENRRDMSLEPLQNRYVRALQRHHWLPTLIGRRQFLDIVNFINCESHLDILKSNLRNKLIQK